MKCQYVVAAAGLVCLLASPGWGQPIPAPVEDLRREIQMLNQKLQSLETAGKENHRVTQLGGGTRLRGREPEMVVRIYDLSDLFAMALPYVAEVSGDLGENRPVFPGLPSGQMTGVTGMGGMGMGGGFFNVKPRAGVLPKPEERVLAQMFDSSARSSIDELIGAITSTISPTEWDQVGGPASIAPLGNSLLVSADEGTHQQIDDLLNLFRKRWGTLRTVSVRAQWLWLSAAELDLLLVATDKQPLKEYGVVAFGLVDEAAWQKLLEAEDQRRAGYHAVITGYNGQTVHTVSGSQSLAVTSMIPVVGGGGGEGVVGGSVGYHPQVSVIQEGAALQVTPIVNTSGKFVVLDIHSRVVERDRSAQPAGPLGQPRQVAVVSSAQAVAAVIDRPQLMVHRLSTTLRLPVNRRMLIGGMTYESVPKPDDLNLYLFVKASVQELRDDQPQPKSDAPPKPKVEEKPKKKR